MIILPAIDLKDGRCVRLYKGAFDTVHSVADDPTEVARDFAAAGAKMIHMVDLDGARSGVRKNEDIIRAVCETCAQLGVKVELGGGMRTMSDIEKAEELGVYRFVIGSAAVEDRDFVSEAVKKYGERIAVGVDAKDGRVRTHGWEADSGLDAVEFARDMQAIGVKTVIFTDIDTDGALSGPPIERLKVLRASVSCDIVASGGVAQIGDITALRDIGMNAAIIGKAYYAGTIDLKEAVLEAEKC